MREAAKKKKNTIGVPRIISTRAEWGIQPDWNAGMNLWTYGVSSRTQATPYRGA
jgi:hypothetical protein